MRGCECSRDAAVVAVAVSPTPCRTLDTRIARHDATSAVLNTFFLVTAFALPRPLQVASTNSRRLSRASPMRPPAVSPGAACAAPASAPRPPNPRELLAAVVVVAAGGVCLTLAATAVTLAVLWASRTPWAAASAAIAAAKAASAEL